MIKKTSCTLIGYFKTTILLFLLLLLVDREELLLLSKENEQFEDDLTEMRTQLQEESKNKKKLEQVLRDAAQAMKHALTVSI